MRYPLARDLFDDRSQVLLGFGFGEQCFDLAVLLLQLLDEVASLGRIALAGLGGRSGLAGLCGAGSA